MKLLVDNQLPVALARFFEAKGFECRHVREVGLSSAIDADIWEYARERGFVIVTKDEDFPSLAGRSGPGSPRIGLGAARELPEGDTPCDI